METPFLGSSVPKLGFGLMRLPFEGSDPMNGAVRIDEVKEMVDRFLARGFTYFDTAYVYGGGRSEEAIREALVRRYPRTSFLLADKLPIWGAKSRDALRPIFDKSLARTGAGYFDYYLLHALDAEVYETSEKVGAWTFVQELKAAGLVRHAGFSFHDSPEVLEKILSAHPEAEFVQLQINYADWEDAEVQSRGCYEVARRHGKPVIVMEPVKGGNLADLNPAAARLFQEAVPGRSPASWALRYAASLEGVITVLSGMSTVAQMDDNLATFADFRPLDEAERAVVARVAEVLRNIPTIPCTACQYCVEGCPQKIRIPMVLKLLNDITIYGNPFGARIGYTMQTRDSGKASACIACGVCEEHCPQHIGIIGHMETAARTLE